MNEYLPLNPSTHDALIARMRELGLLNDSTAAPSRLMGLPVVVSPFVPVGEVRFRDTPSFIRPEEPKFEMRPWSRWMPVTPRIADEVQADNEMREADLRRALAELFGTEED